MRWHLLTVVLVGLAILDAAQCPLFSHPALAQQPGAGFTAAIPPESRAASAPDWRGNPVALDLQVAADPFQYRVPEKSGGFVPAGSVDLPAGIRVLGILVIEGVGSLAALQLPGDNDVYYVREGDDLQIRLTTRGTTSVRRATSPPSSKQPRSTSASVPSSPSNVFYLKIDKITAEQVVVYPQHNPTNVHVYR